MQVSTRKEPNEGECVAMELVRPEHKTRLEIPQEPAARSHYPCEDGGAKEGNARWVQGQSPDGSWILTRSFQKELKPQRVSCCLRRCKEERQIPQLPPCPLPIPCQCSHWPKWQNITWQCRPLGSSEDAQPKWDTRLFLQSCALPMSSRLTAEVHCGSKMCVTQTHSCHFVDWLQPFCTERRKRPFTRIRILEVRVVCRSVFCNITAVRAFPR